MRALLALLLFVPIVAATEPAVVYVDESRQLPVGALGFETPDAAGIDPTTSTIDIPVDACHVQLRGSLSWDPPGYGASIGSRGFRADSSMRVRLENASGPIPGADWTFFGGFGDFQQLVAPSTDVMMRVTLLVGANAAYHVRVSGWLDPANATCV